MSCAMSYPLNAEVNAEVCLVQHLIEVRVHDQGAHGRYVVGDNLFTSITVTEKLLTQGLTYVGTICKNRRDILPSMIAKNNDEFSSIFAFDGNKTVKSMFQKKKSRSLFF